MPPLEKSPLTITLNNYRQLFQQFIAFIRNLPSEKIPWLLLIASIVYYNIVFSLQAMLAQASFATSAYDVGLFDQAIWLLSRFLPPFTTIKGVNIFGDHFSLYNILLAPGFWFWNNINFLYFIQTLFLSLAAIPIFFYAKKKLNSSWLALTISLSFLLYPALQNMNLENFHPETLAVFFFSLALFFLFSGNYAGFIPCLLLTIIGKEDISLTIVFLGLYLLFFRRQTKPGLITLSLGLAWYFLATRLFMPLLNGINPFTAQPLAYSYWFQDLSANLFNPAFYINRFFSAPTIKYLYELLIPLLFLPLFSPATLFIIIPSLFLNIISGNDYLRSIHYHYNYMTIPILYFAVIEGLFFLYNRFGSAKALKTFGFCLLVLIPALIFNAQFSCFPLLHQAEKIQSEINGLSSDRNETLRDALKLIPSQASVSASYYLVPHLTRRPTIFMFPNPFRACYWNMWFKEGRDLPPIGNSLDYLVLDKECHEPQDRALVDQLANSLNFQTIFQDGQIMVLENSRLIKNKKTFHQKAVSISQQPNLLKNGGFELILGRDVPLDWRVECWQDPKALCVYSIVTSNSKVGHHSAKLEHHGTADSRWVQEVEVQPRTTYKLSGWIKTENVGPKGQGAILEADETTIKTVPLSGSQDWNYVEIVGRTGRNQKILKILCRLGYYGATTSGTAYFDDIQLREAPNNN